VKGQEQYATGAPHQGPASAATPAFGILPAIAHDLRGPIHTLVATAEILANDLDRLPPDQVRRMVLTMHQQSLWLHGLVENLLAAATIYDGHFHVQPRPMSLTYAVAEIEPIVAPLLAQKRQRLHSTLPAPAPDVLADSRRIGQVLVNLIQNASKYSPPDTPIAVTVAPRGDWVRVTVADRGPGLPPEGAQHLFTAFYRAAPREPATTEGVGLGLAIVRHIVEVHGGRLGAEPREGKGAQFWFELPALSQ
jgi:two-component system sensor histidine kinase KdpD